MIEPLKKASSYLTSHLEGDDGATIFEHGQPADGFSSELLPRIARSAANIGVLTGPFAGNETVTKEVIEARYDLKIEVSEDKEPLSKEQLSMLDNALSRLHRSRPTDLAGIDLIRFKAHDKRRGAAISGREIMFLGAFSRKLKPEEFEGRDISEDLRWLYQEADTEVFLFHAMAHEIAHIVEPNVKPSFYGQLWAESFAEDYRIYITSGGKKVVKFDLNGNEVPNYEERFDLLRENYPISSNP